MTTTATVLSGVNAVLAGVSAAMPEFFVAFNAIKAVWQLANPTGTPADFHAYLLAQAAALTTDADAVLLADGYVRDPATGRWTKPAAAPATTAV